MTGPAQLMVLRAYPAPLYLDTLANHCRGFISTIGNCEKPAAPNVSVFFQLLNISVPLLSSATGYVHFSLALFRFSFSQLAATVFPFGGGGGRDQEMRPLAAFLS